MHPGNEVLVTLNEWFLGERIGRSWKKGTEQRQEKPIHNEPLENINKFIIIISHQNTSVVKKERKGRGETEKFARTLASMLQLTILY
jgi:hypothetical protein